MITLPCYVSAAIAQLERAGFETWVVGGCVRDSLLGRPPHDWDLCTRATPAQMQQIFCHMRTIPTGLAHGTLTVLPDEGDPLEITTYRADGPYSDGRHPDTVRFVHTIDQDLARRDFTIGAMAWHPTRGLYDPYGGQRDLAARVLRCVGDPDTRFTEDALRILRGLRFAAAHGLTIEPTTAAAMYRQRARMHALARERVYRELCRVLCAPYVRRVLLAYAPVLLTVLPALAPMLHCAQQNPYHRFDVWEHSAWTVGQVPATPTLRLAALLHDCGKPACKTVDQNGIGHFYGHAKVSVQLGTQILRELRAPNAVRDDVLFLIEHHDTPIGDTPRLVRRRLAQWGEKRVRLLLALQRGDRFGQQTHPENMAALHQTEALVHQVLWEQACLSIGQLAVRGGDLMALGRHGAAVGEALRALLDAVLDDRIPNTREALLAYAATLPQ